MESNLTENKLEFKLSNIELLEFSSNFNETLIPDLKLFHYNLNIEHRIIEDKKLVIVTVHAQVIHENQENILATVKASCIYEITNLNDILRRGEPRTALPVEITLLLNSITISTVRGIMFSLFRGTYLHYAFLPVIDPVTLMMDHA